MRYRNILTSFIFSLTVAGAPKLANPLFNGGDPWVTWDHGTYYYSASYCGLATICLKTSTTLTGLATAPWTGVWNAPAQGPNSQDVWAPEIHKVNGRWYIYYAADDGNNDNHRLFVLQATTDNPLSTWAMADTGGTNGQLLLSGNHWAIDPDVFTAADGKLYVVWSCTNFANSTFPLATCLAQMGDPLHVASATAQISTPTQAWETRTAPIQEGPVGFTHAAQTFITYSASASWTPDDYAVGLLTHSGGSLLDPGSWFKTGPIFDHHGKTYGPGSVVFVPSPDGKETWNLYHAIESLSCNPSYNCRDIRMQKMTWAADGSPVLGYPLDPGVSVGVPSGEAGRTTGTATPAWGDAFGDAAEGNASAGLAAGDWVSSTDGSVRGTSLGAQSGRTFWESDPNLTDYTLAVDLQLLGAGTTSGSPKYGVYAAYSDAANYVTASIDATRRLVETSGTISNVDRGVATCMLPSGVDTAAFNTLEVHKTGNVFSVFLNGAHINGPCNDRTFEMLNGQSGLVTEDVQAVFRNFRVIPTGPVFTTAAVVNSATYNARSIAPGEIVSIFGRGLGPVLPAIGFFSGNPPKLATSVGGVQVLFDGAPAPLFYVSDSMLNIQAPFELAGKTSTRMLVSYNGSASNWITVGVAAADPGVYAVVNYDDGGRNTSGDPVAAGHVVSAYGTGQGVVSPPVASGVAAPTSPLSSVADASITVAGIGAKLLYAGLTPGFAGLTLINFEVPAAVASGQQTVELTIAGRATHFPLWVK